MLVAAITIRIDDADILDHAVKVDDAIGRTAKHRRHPSDEYIFGDRLALQTLPPAAVQHTHVGHAEGNALALERLNKLGPDNIGKSISQDLGLSPLCSTIANCLQIKICISPRVATQTANHLCRKGPQTLNGGPPRTHLSLCM